MSDSGLAIGLIEDDADIAGLVSMWLTSAGFKVRHFASGSDFRRRLGSESIDGLILDWMLPDSSGLEILQTIRTSAQSKLPVVFLTGRGSEQDIVTALREGADDYVVKPPRQAELLARLNAVLRRTGALGESHALGDVSPYSFDISRRQVLLNGAVIDLTDREFDLSLYLFRRPGRVVSRDSLLEDVWKLNASVATRTVDTHISRLRKKLELNGDNGWSLAAVYQHGYRLEHAN